LAGTAAWRRFGGEFAWWTEGSFLLCRSLELGEFGGLLFGDYLLALGRAVESLDFAGGEFAELARSDVEAERSVTYATDLFHMMADLFEHFSELAVAAFDEGDLVPGVVAAADEFYFGGGGDDSVATAGAYLVETAAIDHDALADLLETAGGWDSADFDEVGLFYSGGGPGERVGEIAVVGHEEQALGEVVEAAYGVEAGEFAVEAGDLFLRGFGEELDDGGAVLGVVECGDVAARLVEHEVAVGLWAAEELAVYADVVACGVVAGAEGGDDGSVDLDAAFEDDLLGLAAGGDTGLGEDLLKTVALWGFFGGSGSGVLRHDVGFLTAEGLVAVGEELFRL